MEETTQICDERVEITIVMTGFRKKLLSTVLSESFVTNLKTKIMSSKTEEIEVSKVPLVKISVKEDKVILQDWNRKWNK